MPGKTEQKKGVQRSPITPLEFQYEEMFSSDAKKLLVSLRAGRYVFKSDAGRFEVSLHESFCSV